jgi:hypothetical protein
MGFTTIRMKRILQSKGVTEMGHLDVPEVLIALGVAAFVWLAFHNWALGHHHGHHVRR